MERSPHFPAVNHWKLVILFVAISGMFFGLAWIRAFYGSMQAYGEAEAFLKSGNLLKAVTYFDRSLHWYTPFNPYVQRSAQKLWDISLEAEKRGDLRLSIIAVSTLRSGFVAARSVFMPGKDWIERCNGRLKELRNLQERIGGEGGEGGVFDGSILDDPQVRGPHILWSIAGVIGFLGWVGSAAAAIVSGKRAYPEARRIGLSTGQWILSCAIFWVVWIVGLVKA